MDEFIVITPNPTEAHTFYKKYIYTENIDLTYLCNKYGFENRPPYAWKWELFTAALVGDKKRSSKNNEKCDYNDCEFTDKYLGADLINHEVKSAEDGSAFEYQYHIKCWYEKLKEDRRVSHVYISYSEEYKDITVRLLPGTILQPYFDEWEQELQAYWKNETNTKISNKRFRRKIPFAKVKNDGRIICVIKNTELAYSSYQGMESDLLLKSKKK